MLKAVLFHHSATAAKPVITAYLSEWKFASLVCMREDRNALGYHNDHAVRTGLTDGRNDRRSGDRGKNSNPPGGPEAMTISIRYISAQLPSSHATLTHTA